MKKSSFLLSLLVLTGSLVMAQQTSKNAIALSIAPEQVEQQLSSAQQARIQKLRQSDDYLSIQVIEVSNLTEAVKNDKVEFDIPGRLGRIQSQTQSLDFTSESNFQYNGKFKGGEALLISENGRTYGQIRSKGSVYDIQYLENGYATLIEYNMEKLNQMSCATPDTDQQAVPHQQNNGNDKGTTLEGQAAIGSLNASVTVLVLFTPAAANTGLNMSDLANTARAQWLSASINSQVVTSLNIVGVQPLNFIENSSDNNISQDVEALRNNIFAQQLRDNFEADLVLLLTNGDYNPYSGYAADIGPNEDEAYAIVQVANATSTVTWAHEAAHLFGARHEFAADDTPRDAHGHEWSKGWFLFYNHYGSIMRTGQEERDRVLYFSNPNVTHEGNATGVSGTSYNTKTLNINGNVLEDFRITQQQPNLAVAIYGPGSANDGDALSFSSGIGNGQSPYTYQWRVNTGTGYYTVSSSSILNFTMPTGKDLEITLNLSDGSGQAASDYHFVQNLFLGGGPCTVCPDSTLMDAISTADVEIAQRLEQKDFTIYPNPTSNKLTYSLPPSEKPTTLQIIDFSGKVIKQIEFSFVNFENNMQSLDVTSLKAGIYFLKINNVDGFEKTIRFIKQ